MKKFLVVAMAFGLLLISPAAYAQAEEITETLPSVAPPLVREGDFAIRLISALEIGTAENEIEAEALLASYGIAPVNGWISDYPVTPDIIGELQDAVAAAAESERLPLDRYEALEALEIVLADFGLSVVADTSGGYAETQPPVSPQYTEPTVVNNYYYTHGPPVFTYYPPPLNYGYLYAWVPYPFWCSGYIFSGFFILHDFHKVSFIRKRAVVVTNHVFHRRHRRFHRVDPVKRRKGKSWRAAVKRRGRRAFATDRARRGAQSILKRSHDRTRSPTRPTARTIVTAKSGRSPAGRIRDGRMPGSKAKNWRTARSRLKRNRDRTRPSARPNTKTIVTAKPGRSGVGKISAERGRELSAHNGRSGRRHQIASKDNSKAVSKRSVRSLGTPNGSKWRSSSRPSKDGRGFSGHSHRGRRTVSKRFSGNSPVAGFARGGGLRGRI